MQIVTDIYARLVRRGKYSRAGVASVILMGLWLWTSLANAELNFKHVADFIDAYGEADNKQADVQKAAFIFAKLRRITSLSLGYKDDLFITNESQNLRAQALKSGIVISRATIAFCYDKVSPPVGDARLAFVLGHELAHQTNRDMNKSKSANFSHAELDADELGFVYAAIAGYEVASLVQDPDFFVKWHQRQGVSMADKFHGSPKKRVAALQEKLNMILEPLKIFKFGTRLAHFGRYQQASYFLEDFQTVFESPETLNNLGYVQLQQAVESMLVEHGSYEQVEKQNLPYCLPVMLDLDNRAELLAASSYEVMRARGTSLKYLEAAKIYFERAVMLDEDYAPALLNLAVTLFYMEDYYTSFPILKKALKLLPKPEIAQGLKALIVFNQGKGVDTWENSIATLQTLADKPNARACDVYNTALLLDKRKLAEADIYWKKLYAQVNQLPAFRTVLCAQTPCKPPKKSAALPLKLPVALGEILPATTHLEKAWLPQDFDFTRKIKGHIYQKQDDSAEMLAFNSDFGELAEMLVLNQPDLSLAQARTACGAPLQQYAIAGDKRLYRCGSWALLMQENIAKEVWLVH